MREKWEMSETTEKWKCIREMITKTCQAVVIGFGCCKYAETLFKTKARSAVVINTLIYSIWSKNRKFNKEKLSFSIFYFFRVFLQYVFEKTHRRALKRKCEWKIVQSLIEDVLEAANLCAKPWALASSRVFMMETFIVAEKPIDLDIESF